MKKNIKIGLSAVASSVTDNESKKKIDKALKILIKIFFQPKFIKGKTLDSHYYWNAGTDKERLDDFIKIQKKSDIFVSAKGGYGCLDLIDKIDYKTIKRTTKFIGFSDVSALLLAIYSKIGIITYHGPDMKKISIIDKDSLDNLYSILTEKSVSITIPDSSIKSIKSTEKEITGILIGGNLSIFAALIGTPFLKFDKKNKYILFFEDTDQSPPQVDFLLKQIILKLPEIMSKNISAVVLGNFKNYLILEYKSTYKSEINVFKKYFKVPIIKTDFFGHGQKKFMTFPIGAKTTITKDLKKITFHIN